jgi:hypothetical protein
MTFDRLSTLAALCLLPAILLPSPAEAQSFQGTFTGDGVMMTLQPSRDRFYGTLVFDDEFYSIEADEADGALTGSFVTAKGEFDFRATFRGRLLELETNSVTYVLRRAGQGAADEPEPEPAAVAQAPPPPAPGAEPAKPETEVAGATEPDDSADDGGVLASMDFEDGILPSGGDGSGESPAAARTEPARTKADSQGMRPTAPEGRSRSAEPLDQALVGAWQRATIAADAGGLLADATDFELAADGTFTAAGAGGGHWKATQRTLYLRSTQTQDWQPYCRYKLVADTLLCSVDEDSRQLWFRR